MFIYCILLLIESETILKGDKLHSPSNTTGPHPNTTTGQALLNFNDRT